MMSENFPTPAAAASAASTENSFDDVLLQTRGRLMALLFVL